jgi:hypothetical protein
MGEKQSDGAGWDAQHTECSFLGGGGGNATSQPMRTTTETLPCGGATHPIAAAFVAYLPS